MGDVRVTKFKTAGQITALAGSGAREGVRMVTEMLRRDAGATCPIDTGNLRNSAQVTVAGSNGVQAKGTVRYTAPYAVYAHEKPGQNYQGSGRYKWLQLTAEEQAGKYGQVMADAMRRAVGK